jgi:hypothetical protein
MAGLGSLYVWLADSNSELANVAPATHCSCPHCPGPVPSDGMFDDGVSPRASATHQEHQESYPGPEGRLSTVDSVGEWVPRRKIANALGKIGNYFGNPAKDPFGAGDFRTGEWPRIPGEAHRNDRMTEQHDRYSIMEEPNSPRDSQGSDSGSVAPTPASPTSPAPPVVPLSPRGRSLRPHANSIPSRSPSRNSSFEQMRPAAAVSQDPRGRSPARRATLQVPPSAHHRF